MREKTENFFKTVMKSGGLFSSKYLSVKAVKGIGNKSNVRVVVSKKVAPKAVSRNRLKRQIRGLFNEIKPRAIQAVFYAKKGVNEITLKELRKEISYILKNIDK